MDGRLPKQQGSACEVQLPEVQAELQMRSCSPSVLQISKGLAVSLPHRSLTSKAATNIRCASNSCELIDVPGSETESSSAAVHGNPSLSFSFASSPTSRLVLERIISQSEISPLTSGRLSHSDGPLNGGSLTEETDSPSGVFPSDQFDDVIKYFASNNTLKPLFTGGGGGGGGGSAVTTPAGVRTVGRWLKERKEKKKEDARAHNAQLHAVVSVASVAAAVAAITAATAAASAASRNDDDDQNDQMARTDAAVASAATLVAAQCVEAAEAMGAERGHLVSAISSAVNVHSHGDITTLTAAAATALRGAATLKARTLKEVGAVLIPAEKQTGVMRMSRSVVTSTNEHTNGRNYCEGLVALEENFLDGCNQDLLARGTVLLKRTRKGDLHWKMVSVYIHRTGQVMLKMKSRHVAGTVTKKKKSVVLEVCRDVASWPGRHLIERAEQRHYFGLKTATTRGVIEFECKNQREYKLWTQGVSRLLSITAEQKYYYK